MAAEWITPVEETTGMPCIILPFDVPAEEIDYHHHYFPRRSPELLLAGGGESLGNPENATLEDLAAMALRMSRGQLLPQSIHKTVHKKLLGPLLPQSVDHKFVATVKGCAGVVSRWALDVRRPEDRMMVRMDDATFHKATDTRLLCTERSYYDKPADYRRRVFGHFFLQYALSKDLDCISPLVVEQFLETQHDERRRELGNFILKEALAASVAPVVAEQRQLMRGGNMQPGRPAIVSSVRKMIRAEILPQYYPVLTEKLQAA